MNLYFILIEYCKNLRINKLKRKVNFNRSIIIDTTDIIQFIEDNSDYAWNDICDLSVEFQLVDDEGSKGTINYVENINPKESKNNQFFQEMINSFYEAHNIDKKESIIVEFTD